MSAYDLILQGGTLYDPCAGTMELCDLAIKDGKIAARGKNLNAADAETVMDVTGLIVSPGLIDMHCHVYPVFPYQMPDSLRTINAEEYMFRARCYHCGGRRYHRLAQLWRLQGKRYRRHQGACSRLY